MTSHVCPLRNQRDKPARRFAAFAAMLCFTPFLYADDAVDHAKELLQSAPVFDGHNDLPWVYREYFDGDVEGYDISVKAQYDTDIPRLRAGGVGAQFWSVYVPTSLSPLEALRAQLEQIDIAHRMIRQYPDDLVFAGTLADVQAAHRRGQIASLLGIEGGHVIANSLGALRSYYELGVRYMTLTHFHSNDWADSATDTARHEGLTDFGREVVREMNRLGMIVDLSHVSEATMNDALDVSRAPVMFSHSSAKALAKSPRNVPDSVLERVAENGGVVMVTFIPGYVNDARREWDTSLLVQMKDATSAEDWDSLKQAHVRAHGNPPIATLSDVANHIEHVARVAGHAHVGIGSDFYGASGDDLVQGLEDVSKFPDLVAELVRRGWDDDDLAKLTWGNMLRVLGQVEAVGALLRREQPPSLMQLDSAE